MSLKVALTLIVLIVLAALAAAGYVWYALTQPYQGFAVEGVFVNVPHGASSRGVARLLKRNGVIRSAAAFEIYARRHPKRTLQAGEYFFSAPVSGRDVFWKLAQGQIYEQPFTVREGETIFDIAHDLEVAKFMPAAVFVQAASDPMPVRDLAPRARTVEGFLYPATYNLPRHPTGADVVKEMVAHFKSEWSRIAQAGAAEKNATANGRSVEFVVTLASLVERETPKPEERPVVAGVFENRLRVGMPLQCDPTVIYAMEQNGEYNRLLTGQDLHYDSPYNTYTHSGLPPGPIGNPGEASLRAALQPAQSDYLYFVANTQGGHFFGATLAEHNKNVTKYRRLLAGLPADPPPDPTPAPKPASKKRPQPKHQRKHHKSTAS
jgi:UPF0755 protein